MASPTLFLILCFTYFSLSFSQTLFLPLTHSHSLSLSLSQTQYNTTHHLIKAAATRSVTRFHRHQHHRKTTQVSLPLAPGSDYTLTFTLGTTPPQHISLYMDTGSDLVWFPCSPFDCILCEGKPNSTFPSPQLPKNTAVSCDSHSCSAAHSALSSRNASPTLLCSSAFSIKISINLRPLRS